MSMTPATKLADCSDDAYPAVVLTRTPTRGDDLRGRGPMARWPRRRWQRRSRHLLAGENRFVRSLGRSAHFGARLGRSADAVIGGTLDVVDPLTSVGRAPVRAALGVSMAQRDTDHGSIAAPALHASAPDSIKGLQTSAGDGSSSRHSGDAYGLPRPVDRPGRGTGVAYYFTGLPDDPPAEKRLPRRREPAKRALGCSNMTFWPR